MSEAKSACQPNGSANQVGGTSMAGDVSQSNASPLPSARVSTLKSTNSLTVPGPIIIADVTATPTFGYTVLLIFGMVTFALSYGMPTSTSAFFLDWQETFQVSRAQAATVHATCLGILNTGAIIPGYMMNRFGARPTLLTGSCLATSGLILSVFATSITHMVICNGILTGLGFCMLNLPVIPCVTQAFSSHRSIIISCLSFGSSISNAGLTYFYRYLADQFSWQGAFFILAGIAFNSCITGLVITSYIWKPMPPGIVEVEKHPLVEEEILRDRKSSLCSEDSSGTTVISEPDPVNGHNSGKKSLYEITTPSLIDGERTCQGCRDNDHSSASSKTCGIFDQRDDYNKDKECQYHIISQRLIENKSCQGCDKTDDEESMTSSEDHGITQGKCNSKLHGSKFKFLLHPLYILVVVNTALCIPCIGAVIFLVLDFAENKGFKNESSGVFFLFIAFVFSAVGKVVCGLLNLVPKLKSIFIMVGFGFLGTASLVSLAYLDSYDEITVSLAVLGLCYGGLAGIYPKCVLDSRSVDAKTFPLALGIANSAEGIFDSSTPILMGYLVDLQGSYTFPLLLFASVCSVASILLLVMNFFHKR